MLTTSDKGECMSEAHECDVIYIGNTRAVISQVYPDGSVEVVYLSRDRAINEDAVKKDGKWEFKISGPCGGYADNYPRLARYVTILRSPTTIARERQAN